MLSQYPYYSYVSFKETYANGVFIPNKSQKIKNKRLRAKQKKRGKK